MENNIQITKIYALKCPNDGTIKYVGKTTQTLEQRLLGHISTALRKKNLKGKHEWLRVLYSKGTTPEIILLEECENWIEREQHWIEEYSRTNVLFNMTKGGEDWVFKTHHQPWNKGGGKYTPEMIQAMSDAKKGKKASEQTKQKMSQAAKGKVVSQNVINSIKERSIKRIAKLSLYKGRILAIYSSATEAAKSLGVLTTNICRAARLGTVSAGFKWKYI